MNNIEIYTNKLICFGYLLLGFFFFGMGYFVYQDKAEEMNILISIVLFAVGIWIMLDFGIKCFNSNPEIIINRDGIEYYKYLHRKRFIKWKDVDYITERRVKNTKYIDIYMKKEKEKKFIISHNDKLYDNGKKVSFIGFIYKGYTHQKLMKLIISELEKSRR